MFKIKNTLKKLSVFICTMLVMVTNISLPVHAAESNVRIDKVIPYSYNGRNTTLPYEYPYQGSIVDKIYADNEIAFCVQPEQELVINGSHTKSNYSYAQQSQMERIAYAGWHMSNKTDDDYVATQFMIWEAMGMEITSTSFSGYAAKKAEINEKLNLFNKFPSFDNTSLTLRIGESKTVTDTNGVFQNYYLTFNSDGISVNKSGNTLTITANANAPENAQIKYQYVKKECVGTSILYASETSQNVVPFKVADPHETRINITVQKFGNLKIAKQNEKGEMVPNTTFKLSYQANMSSPIGTYTTGDDGTVTIQELEP
ncbi:head-tail adaptor protein, partial [bacterium c-19]|nr:head-tail adaptor protein [bacterium c-19]